MAEAPELSTEQKHWLVRPENIRKLWILFIVILAVVALLDFVIHPHAEFGIDGTPFFYSWYGLVTCVGMVVFAKLLSIFLKREDTYYGD